MFCPFAMKVSAIRFKVPVEDKHIASDFPLGRSKGHVELTLDLDTRKVRGWPVGRMAMLYVEARDRGNYDLLLEDGQVIASITHGYVPDCFPRDGEDLALEIGTDGTVAGWWPSAKDVADSFERKFGPVAIGAGSPS